MVTASSSDPARSAGRRVLRHEILLGLRSGILSGEIPHGTRLLEIPLSTELGVSRGPVREALRQLEQEGLVEFFPHRGAIVVGVADAEMDAIYGIRALLEERAFARGCSRHRRGRARCPRCNGRADDRGKRGRRLCGRDGARHALPRQGRRAVRVPVPAATVDEHRRCRAASCRPRRRAAGGRGRGERAGPADGSIGRAPRARRGAPHPSTRDSGQGRPDAHLECPGAPPRRGAPVIRGAEVLVLSHRLSRTRLFGTGFNLTRDSVIVRLVDGDGRVGWGETYLVPGAVEASRAMAAELIGRDPDAAAAGPRGRTRAAPLGPRRRLDGPRRSAGTTPRDRRLRSVRRATARSGSRVRLEPGLRRRPLAGRGVG